MSEFDVFLSICIPTYNRCEFLRKTIESIVTQDAFIKNNEIEIIISDNDSSDGTFDVVRVFCDLFPGKIRYYKNDKNLGPEKNYELVLSKGNGHFLKLHNDTLIARNGSLNEIIKVIKATVLERPIIFFSNGSNGNLGKQIQICNGVDEFVRVVSYFSTWIGGFGIWKEDFKSMSNFSLCADLQLIQTDILMRFLSSGKRAVVLSDMYFFSMTPENKGGYNTAEVFGKNYLSILKKYISLGELSEKTFREEKISLLKNHIVPLYFGKNKFLKTGFFGNMEDFYSDDFFYEEMERVIQTLLQKC